MSVKTIKPEDVLADNTLSTVCLVDVRTPAEVRHDALDKIVAMPLDQLDPQALSDIIKRDYADSNEVYLICQSGKRAQLAAEQLAGQLSQDILIVEGGMNAIRQSQGVTQKSGKMSLERQVRLTAGSMVFAGVLLGYFVNPAWFGLSGFVGAGLVFSAVTDTCAMGLLIAKAPWNR